MRVLVCGGRDYKDFEKVKGVLDGIRISSNISQIIHGGALGADTLAETYGRNNSIPTNRFDALWDLYGKSAGAIRNRRMLEEGCPDMVIAFPGGKGTANMVKIAKEAGVEVKEITND